MSAKETDLCEAFARRAKACGWTVYPEIDGWDLLLVWTGDAPPPRRYYAHVPEEHEAELRLDDPQPGDQIGIHAKLRPNVDVLEQAIRRRFKAAPNFRAVLVPKRTQEFETVATALRVEVYTETEIASAHITCEYGGHEAIVEAPHARMRWHTPQRHWLPPIVPTFAGGAPSPRILSPWRVGALRLCALLRERGHLVGDDFKREGVTLSTWVQRGWIVGEGQHPRRYVVAAASALPDVGYEAERDAIVAADTAAGRAA